MADALVAFALLAPQLFVSLAGQLRPDYGDTRLVILSVVMVAPLPLRRVAPRMAGVVSLVAVAVSATAGYGWTGAELVVAAFVWQVAHDRGRRDQAAWLLLAGWVATLLIDEPPTVQDLTAVTGIGLLALAWGTKAGARDREAARAREAEARAARAVADERGRIARDLHDIVAHHVSGVALLASAAAPASGPTQAEALNTIADQARIAVDEMRRMVGVLRPGDGREPIAAGLSGRAALDETARAALTFGAGRCTVAGAELLGEVAPGVAVTVARCAQEAVTNAIRHAGRGVGIDVDVRAEGDAVVATVDDDGRGTPDPASAALAGGNGLVGMRERAEVAGGTLAAGPRDGGGWRVELRVPRSGGSGTMR